MRKRFLREALFVCYSGNMNRLKVYSTLQNLGETWLADERAAREAGESTIMTENAGIAGVIALKLAGLVKPAEPSSTDTNIDIA